MASRPDHILVHDQFDERWSVFELAAPAYAAVARKLDLIRESSETITDLSATRTSHRLEWYVIALIAFEIVLGLVDKVKWFKGG